MTRALITGGTGFIGSYLARRLLDAGEEVVLLDLAPNPELLRSLPCSGMRGHDVEIVSGDVTSFTALFQAVHSTRPDIIFHLASPLPPETEFDPPATVRRIVQSHLAVLEVARYQEVRRVVWASATSVFGPPDSHGGEGTVVPNDAPHHPTTVYGVAKSACEHLSAVYRSTRGVESVGLRFNQGYGPGKTRGRPFGYELFERALAGTAYEVPFGDGLVNWQFVEDMAELLFRAAAVPLSVGAPLVFNTTGDVLTMRCSVSLLSTLCPQASLSVASGRTGLTSRYDTTDLHQLLTEVPFTTAEVGFSRTLQQMSKLSIRRGGLD